ncbi:hypothetical protein GKN94_00615 [Candidatus Lucifugimonas marina]|uniref:Uncharacterized protein n=1 Tax=Candidatus Lucifugimonas marina TaxID=3038979 RepID=A0AAJ5ZB92_9CHLR|nr:hypothetical protein GKN94_00615 [SAR202 cluster bacterium JH545]WFG38172.1 hypothetical protein GKO48_00630 [SAR202 cluster bacterium JH1073]
MPLLLARSSSVQHHNNHNIGQKVLAKGMELQAQSKHQHHYRGRSRVPYKIRLAVFLAVVIVFFWWVYS